jgi:alkanesulfonate monooxygenase SsuD/methylene tetrahydromethanopterin reductase-like flavin-dependent oxidoreductase (luciferase family)
MGYTVADVYSRVFRRFGFRAEVDAMQRAWQRGERREALHSISDRMVEALGVIGTAEVCRTRLRQFAEAGITLPIVLPFTPEAASAQGYRRTIGALAAQALEGYGILR